MVSADEKKLLDSVPDGLFIDGRWRPQRPARPSTSTTRPPVRTIKSIADASAERRFGPSTPRSAAADDWARTPARQRAEVLRRTFELVQQRKDDIALLMTLEMGKPLGSRRRR